MSTRRTLANTIRILTMDAVQKAQSGHPGAPMGMADIAEVLWNDFLKHNPNNPKWMNRDRFILSNGHGSMLIYSLLHLSGYPLSIEDIKNFRQLHSKTPGHPENTYTEGVETTTGPLGAGIANAVGMAIAEKTLAAQFNRQNFPIVDHFTYCFLGDGCLMEGISHEVCSLAGTLKLGKLIAFWDDNGISIDGEVEGWFTDNTAQRFKAYGWQVIENVDGHNSDAIHDAIKDAQSTTSQPTLICCKTTIGMGSPNKSGSHACHGAPLGNDEILAARQQLDWPHAPFDIPQDIYDQWNAQEKGKQEEKDWRELFNAYKNQFPDLADELKRRTESLLPDEFERKIDEFIKHTQATQTSIATRKSSQQCIEFIGDRLPELLGGSADLAGSNLTLWPNASALHEHDNGNYLHYGVREFGMGGILNGLALHGGFACFGATFLMFMEYARNALRMAALMKIRSIFVFTHDSIAQGEDGPTHQPIEQLTNLRTTPNLMTWRPCDSTETAVAWKHAIMNTTGPTALALSRQTIEAQQRTHDQINNIHRGAYALHDVPSPDAVIIATGSEVPLAIEVAKRLEDQKIALRVVSMPCAELFDQQDENYRSHLIPADIPKISLEAGHTYYWHRYVGTDGLTIGINTFGESAPGGDVMSHFGFTTEDIRQKIISFLR